MADTINVPGAGPVKKPLVYGGIAVLVGILAVAYYRHSKSSAAAAAAPATAATNPDPNAIDPATGLTYGEEAAGIQSGTFAGGGSAFGDTSGIIGYDSAGNPVYADQVGYGPTPNFTTNGNWSQAVQQYLVATTGADAGTVAAALGAYLNGQPLTADQASIVNQGIAFFGRPPLSGSDGYPPSLRLVAPSGSGTPSPVGTCPAGYTFSSTQTGANGEIAATGGTGWCELDPAPAPTPTPTPAPVPTYTGTQVAGSTGQTNTGYPGNPTNVATMPSLVGMSVTAAQRMLMSQGTSTASSYFYISQVTGPGASNYSLPIKSQSIPAGTSAPSNTAGAVGVTVGT